MGEVALVAPRHSTRGRLLGCVGTVAVDGFVGCSACVGRAEVGTVAAENGNPLVAGVLDRLGDQVGDVALAPASHADVGRRGSGVLADDDVGGRHSGALGTVGSGGVGELDVGADVFRRQCPPASVALNGDRTALGSDDGPGLPVGDVGVVVVASGGDAVADADALARGGYDGVGDLADARAHLVGEAVDLGDLLAGVGDDEVAAHCAHREFLLPLDIAGVDDDLATPQ